MSDELRVKLDEQKRAIENAIATREKEFKTLGEQRANIDRRMQVIRDEHLQLKGRLDGVLDLMADGVEEDEVKLTPPKKENSKKKEAKGS